MANYPVHDPADLAKLPDGWYQVRGPEYQDYVPSAVYKRGDEWYDGNAERISRVGGIAYRLVPEDQYELIRTQLEGHFSDMKAQRDELAELLREVAPSCYIEAVAGIPGDCGYCLNCKIIAKLEELQRAQ